METPQPSPSSDARPDATGAPHIAFRDVYMAFGDRVVMKGLTCAFPREKISVIVGGSGVGKSTLLRLIGGLVHPTSGVIEIDGTAINELSESQLYEVRDKIGMMFQNGALLDSLTVFENVAFPLREHSRESESAIADRVHECLESVGLTDVDELLPAQLSGGMTRRVALARAMILRPAILLCDEPFSGLDPISAKRIELLLQRLNRDFNLTIIVISHDVPSTLRMADHIVVLLPDGSFQGTEESLTSHEDPRLRNLLSLEVDPALADPESSIESEVGAPA